MDEQMRNFSKGYQNRFAPIGSEDGQGDEVWHGPFPTELQH